MYGEVDAQRMNPVNPVSQQILDALMIIAIVVIGILLGYFATELRAMQAKPKPEEPEPEPEPEPEQKTGVMVEVFTSNAPERIHVLATDSRIDRDGRLHLTHNDAEVAVFNAKQWRHSRVVLGSQEQRKEYKRRSLWQRFKDWWDRVIDASGDGDGS